MTTSTSPTPAQSFNEGPNWDGLQRAIVASSGFQSWCTEAGKTITPDVRSQEQLVMAYLRETLETLAY